MTLLDDPAFARIARHLERLGAPALSLYRAPCFARRLASRVRARGRTGLADYALLLDVDVEERARLLSALAIGVTGFFRNPSTWHRLANELAGRRPTGSFRAWSAGCATGEEAYSIAMMLDRVAPGEGSRFGDWRIDATDLDERSLAVARRGRYPERAFQEIEAFTRSPVPRGSGELEVPESLRSRVGFRREDVTAPGARGPYDLVVCRNVLIYFGEQGQARVLAALAASLAPGGLLVLGRAEMAAREMEASLALVDHRERLYRRVG